MTRNQQQTNLLYRLPVSRIQIAGTASTSVDALAPVDKRKRREYQATLDLEVVADPRTGVQLEMANERLAKNGLDLKLLEDGRIASTGFTFESGESTRLASIVKVGAFAAAGAVALGVGAPVAVVAAAGVGAAALLSTGAADKAFSEPDMETKEILPEGHGAEASTKTPSDNMFGIHGLYKLESRFEFDLLHGYRRALHHLSESLLDKATSTATPVDIAANVAAIHRAIKTTRTEAAGLEEHYVEWRRSKVATTTTRHQQWLFIDQLPTTDELRKHVSTQSKSKTAWWETFEGLHTAVTCDLDHVDPGDEERSTPPADELQIRPPVWATITTWTMRADTSSAIHYVLELEEAQRVLVAHPAVSGSVELFDRRGSDSLTVGITLHPSGGLASYSLANEGDQLARAKAIGALPDNLLAGAKAGSDLVTGYGPTAAKAAALKAHLARLEADRKISGILYPPADDLAALKQELAELEIQAKIAAAELQVSKSTAALSTAHTDE